MSRSHAVGQILGDLRQRRADAGGDIERIGRRLLDDADRHRGLAVEPGGVALGQRAELDPRDVAQLDREAVGVLDRRSAGTARASSGRSATAP